MNHTQILCLLSISSSLQYKYQQKDIIALHNVRHYNEEENDEEKLRADSENISFHMVILRVNIGGSRLDCIPSEMLGSSGTCIETGGNSRVDRTAHG